MFYTIYKITNNLNGKFYIGKHKTDDLNDGYMGSGKLICRAIAKHGIENFIKEILFVFDNEQEMNDKEKELVVVSEETYNLCSGGQGGFGFINSNRMNGSPEGRRLGGLKSVKQLNERCKADQEFVNKVNESKRIPRPWVSEMNKRVWTGRKHKNETIEKMIVKSSGANNSQFGTCWITNGIDNKKIKKNEIDIWINKGYIKGRNYSGIV